ncbi:uncharacterized protein LOC117764957 isoform X3 [Hippoglossus hippoglossus]|uniref:uncharacterized protein LOC117764957 isoform X3 n=1 Tax=Hippoglossus hippoglossus TaxID=8267 RepID=UPI00148C3C73|nr:uncharacterized protein LOC117764957 isoform X3 [Hippoglossus hippoglossus]
MRERNSPTIKEDSEVSSLVDYIHETTKHTVQRTLRTSPLYRKTQSSNGCQMFSSGRQAVLRHLRRRDMRVYSACSRRLHKVQAQQAAVGPTYSGTATMSLDDSSSEEENMESSSQVKLYHCAPAPHSLLQPPLLMLTSCLHHTKQQTWSDRTFSIAVPSL